MKFLIWITFIGSGLLFSCATSSEDNDNSMDEEADMVAEVDTEEQTMATAMASMSAASDSDVSGSITFTQNGDSSVTMELDLRGLTPGEHAIHLHQNGDCSAPDATSAGGHWNPTNMDHGKRGESDQFHKGDIKNLEVGEDSTYTGSMEVRGWTIGDGSQADIVGKAVIIHAGADDFTSQPSGAAGPRVACGVIEQTNM